MKILFLTIFFSLIAWSPASYASETNVGDGGGGIERKGQFLTFASARIKLRPYEAMELVPGLELLEKTIRNTYMGEKQKGSFLGSIRPGPDRKYFAVDEISEADLAKLMEIYKEIAKYRFWDDGIGIYGLTDRTTRETYLLPNFFRLPDEIQKATALFHENTWIVAQDLNLSPTYNQVVDLEVSFENCLRLPLIRPKESTRPWCSSLYYNLSSFLEDYNLPLVAATRYDMEQRSICAFYMDKANQEECTPDIRNFRLEDLLGKEVIDTWVRRRDQKYRGNEIDQGLLEIHLRNLVNEYPQVQLFKELLNLKNRLYLTVYSMRNVKSDIRFYDKQYDNPQKANFVQGWYSEGVDREDLYDLTIDLSQSFEGKELYDYVNRSGFYTPLIESGGTLYVTIQFFNTIRFSLPYDPLSFFVLYVSGP